MRKYQPIWNKIKAEGSVRVMAPPKHHALIIRMISKEKHADKAYHLQLAEKKQHTKLVYHRNLNSLEVRLETLIGGIGL